MAALLSSIGIREQGLNPNAAMGIYHEGHEEHEDE